MYMYNNQIWKVYTLLFTILYLWGKITFTGTSLSMRNVQINGRKSHFLQVTAFTHCDDDGRDDLPHCLPPVSYRVTNHLLYV